MILKYKKIDSSELIKDFQLNNDLLAYQELLNRYYYLGCKYAAKFISNRCYSNLIHYTMDEINSYVYLSFHKAIKTFALRENSNYDFKKYFFQLIQFDTMYELKKTFNWEIISNYKEICKRFYNHNKESINFNINKDIDIKNKFEIVMKYLSNKNSIYSDILSYKLQGMSNYEIGVKLNTTEKIIKSRSQYIKKILVARFKNIESIN